MGDQYLLRERKSDDSIFYKLPGTKPLYGQDFLSEVTRIFKMETNLDIDKNHFYFDGIHFKIHKTSNGKVLFDDALTVYSIDLDNISNIRDLKLRENTKWFEKKDIEDLNGKWPEIDICIFRKGWKPILEYSFVNDYNIEKEDL